MSKSNILFIINPISGGKGKLEIPALIDKLIDRSKFNPNYSFTEYVGHGAEIAEEAADKNFEVIVAVGGDGTINEIATKVMQGSKILGVIPLGSGNGLARFLNIPMNTGKAIAVINNMHVQTVDTGLFNDRPFFNMAGLGFDAHISSVFAKDKSRGLTGYIRLALKEMLDYQPLHYDIKVDGKHYQRKAFAVSIANSSQYGNNAHIAPFASISDGLLDVCIIREFPLYQLPVLAYQMLSRRTGRTDLVEIIQGSRIEILRPESGQIHLDGEPLFMGKKIDVRVAPLSLNIITPSV